MFPTVGRIVWFHDGGPPARAALVAFAHPGGRSLNLAVFAPDGTTYPRRDVPFVQPGEPAPESGVYACWPTIRKES